MGVMVVVPAFAEGEKGDPPIIAGIVAGLEAAAAPHMRGGVDKPGGVESEDDAYADAPQEERPSTPGVEQGGEDDVGDPVIVVKPDIVGGFGEVGGVLPHFEGVVVIACAENDPAGMGPPGSIAGGVGIAGAIGALMVDAVGSDPGDGSAFERERATESEEVFQKPRHFIGAMGVEAMVSETDAEADGNPIEHEGEGEGAPAKAEQRCESSDVKKRHDASYGPIDGLVGGAAAERLRFKRTDRQ